MQRLYKFFSYIYNLEVQKMYLHNEYSSVSIKYIYQNLLDKTKF